MLLSVELRAAAVLREAQASRHDGRPEPEVRGTRLHPAAVVRQGGPEETVLLHAQEGGRRRRQVHEVSELATAAELFFLSSCGLFLLFCFFTR